ncbi:hypothetical protein [Cupriavidus sp. YAF13]|uniref:hypothetical protein n=1 Tax=Cupriavidus sp. YAF13 TaxID=3233075 RepID=UPI003F920963
MIALEANNMVRRIEKHYHEYVVYDLRTDAVTAALQSRVDAFWAPPPSPGCCY